MQGDEVPGAVTKTNVSQAIIINFIYAHEMQTTVLFLKK
jgi:hypothetical protein